MTVTVLMSTYNGKKYLVEQIESILRQTYTDLRLLVRDDGSSDSTLDILKYYGDLGHLAWYRGANLGPGRSFFDLVQNSPPSDFYAFADQDDVWDPDKIEAAVKCLCEINSDLPAMYCSAVRPVDCDLNILPNTDTKTKVLPSFGLSLAENIAPGCTFVFNRESLEKFKNFKSEYVDMHDWAIYRIIMAFDGIVIYDENAHIAYRQHGNNVIGFSNRGIKKWIARFNRIRDKKYYRIRSAFAENIKNIYYEELSEKNKRILDLIAEYHLSVMSRIKLAISDDIYMSHKTDSMIFSVLAILGLI
ncbi:MAG: glycosyltransferase family 2 protein [Synergistaceae bacterium]|nr:glycosyltransferase family 2 protein [Synergistaceae bacterium]